MALVSALKQRIPQPRLQSRPEYFDSTPIEILATLPTSEGNLVIYHVNNPFSLGAALYNSKSPEQLLWRSEKPFWLTTEKIKVEAIRESAGTITFSYSWKKALFNIEFYLNEILMVAKPRSFPSLQRVITNPILEPDSAHSWESCAVFNTAVLYLAGKVHFVYRAIGDSGLSVLGYAASKDGIHIDERSAEPIYVAQDILGQRRQRDPRYMSGSSWAGCEDPRLTKIDDTIYMTYTAFDGANPPGVALTSISVDDFLNKRWNWQKSRVISAPDEIHKNWVIFPEKINNKFAILHSITPEILIDYFTDLHSDENDYIDSYYASPAGRENYWDSWIRGVGPPPIKIDEGWLILYHAMDRRDPNKYKIGAKILDKNNPRRILYRSSTPLLEPETKYENSGYKAGVVYSCGAVVMNDKLFVYYGGADTVICVATMYLQQLIEQLKGQPAAELVEASLENL